MNESYAIPTITDRGEVIATTLGAKKIQGPESTGHLPANGNDLSFGL